MVDNEDIREHLNKFADTVDKLSDMDININDDLLAIMMLYSLPASYENFRIAIESRVFVRGSVVLCQLVTSYTLTL
jgi:hypothetical protein